MTGSVPLDVAPARPTAEAERTAADRWMRRFLRLGNDAAGGTRADAQKAFQTSIAISAVRCTLMYLVFPFVLPAIGLAQGWGPAIGLVIGAVAVVSMYYSMRRFWRAEHPKRWWYAGLAGAVFVLLVVMAVRDISDLVG
jgi:hypothetical protein